ncbi:MAG TPA: hypothetical protein VMW72_04915 [Sedimentisphaerales bacterium]|nr:hypothetical protein [Sedimentisphaerales bacterium]
MIKIGSFFEEHVEKMVLVVVGLVCVWLLITRVIFSPNEVAYGDAKYSPGSVDDQVYEEAVLLRDKINTPPTDPEPYKSRLSEFVALLDSSISDIDVNLWPQVPYAVDGVISGTGGGQYSLPRIGEVNDIAVEHIRAVAYVPTVAVTAEAPYDKAPHEPNDIDLVTIEAKFDIEGLYERFRHSFVDDVAEQRADPCLAKPIFAAVQLQRQELVEDGSWSDWQVVPRSKIDHYGRLFEIADDVSSLPPGRLKVWKLQFDDPQLQIDLLQPEAYQIASAKEEWYPPLIHRKFLDMQRREDSEERRKEREEEQKSSESTDSRRSRRTPTRSGSSTTGRAGGGLYSGGRGATDGLYGGVGGDTTQRRRSGSNRRRSTDDGLGLGFGSTDRRTRGSRTSRSRTDTGGYEDYMMPGLSGDRLTRRGPSMNDVYDEFDKIRLTWRTPLEKMREPLVFWAHDDTVEPRKSYRYRIRLGVFNPVVGTNQLSEQDMSQKNEVVLWSGFSDITEPVAIPGRLYFFAKHIREAANVVTVQVSKYVMGYWRSEDFTVSQGEVIGSVIENESAKPEISRGSRISRDSRINRDSRSSRDSRLDTLMSPVTRPEDGAVEPETIDFSTGAVMVDAVAVNDWSGDNNLSTRRYYDMLYSFDGTNIEHMPVRTAYWATNLQKWYSEIVRMQRDKPEPLKAWNTSGRRQRTRGAEYEDYGDEYYMEDMMMEGMGGGGRPLY